MNNNNSFQCDTIMCFILDNGGILGIGVLVGLVIGAAAIAVIIVGVVIFIARR